MQRWQNQLLYGHHLKQNEKYDLVGRATKEVLLRAHCPPLRHIPNLLFYANLWQDCVLAISETGPVAIRPICCQFRHFFTTAPLLLVFLALLLFGKAGCSIIYKVKGRV